nr:hypothetical protein CJLB15_00098 [Campylobacter phage CJLB-15]
MNSPSARMFSYFSTPIINRPSFPHHPSNIH